MPPPPESNRALGRLRVASGVLLLVVCAVVAVITFRQSPPEPEWQRELAAFLRRAYRSGLPQWITFGRIEFSANIVMFVPIGFFGALVLPRQRWLVVPIAATASAGIEIVQALRLPERVGSVGDVIANTVGALLGFLLAWLLVANLERRARRRARSADTAPIPVVRTVPPGQR